MVDLLQNRDFTNKGGTIAPWDEAKKKYEPISSAKGMQYSQSGSYLLRVESENGKITQLLEDTQEKSTSKSSLDHLQTVRMSRDGFVSFTDCDSSAQIGWFGFKETQNSKCVTVTSEVCSKIKSFFKNSEELVAAQKKCASYDGLLKQLAGIFDGEKFKEQASSDVNDLKDFYLQAHPLQSGLTIPGDYLQIGLIKISDYSSPAAAVFEEPFEVFFDDN